MTTILIKDALRQSVEAASGGKQTVLFTAKGQPTYMNIITRKTIDELYPTLGLTDIHPAFRIGDKTLSRIYIGTYPATLVNGELLSLPYRRRSFGGAVSMFPAAVACGAGHHLLTGAERGLIQGLFNRDGFIPWAAGSYGKNTLGIAGGNFSGVRVDNKEPGDTSAPSAIYTGSGPTQFRTNNAFNGMADIHNGDSSAWAASGSGVYTLGDMRFLANEIQVIADNSAAAWADLSRDKAIYTGAEWKAINSANGDLIDYTYTGVSGTFAATTSGSVRINNNGTSNASPTTSLQINANPTTWLENSFAAWVTQLPAAVMAKLALYGLVPPVDYTRNGQAFNGTANITLQPGMIRRNSLTMANGPWAQSAGGNADTTLSTFRTAWYSSADLS